MTLFPFLSDSVTEVYFRTLSNICDRAFLTIQLTTAFSETHSIKNDQLGSKYTCISCCFSFTNESNDFERFTVILGRKKSDNVCHEFEHQLTNIQKRKILHETDHEYPRFVAYGNKIDKVASLIKISCTYFKRPMDVQFMCCDQEKFPREKALAVDITLLQT